MNFFRDGAPKYVRCYEKKKDPPLDRYTIVFCHASKFMGRDFIGRVYYVSANGIPTHPSMGIYQHGEAWQGEFCPCGSRITWRDMPEKLQKAVLAEYCDLWGVVPGVDRD
jgi:hypothetical protein